LGRLHPASKLLFGVGERHAARRAPDELDLLTIRYVPGPTRTG